MPAPEVTEVAYRRRIASLHRGNHIKPRPGRTAGLNRHPESSNLSRQFSKHGRHLHFGHGRDSRC